MLAYIKQCKSVPVEKGMLAQCCIPLWLHLLHRWAAVAAQVKVLKAPQLATALRPVEVCCDCLPCNCKIKLALEDDLQLIVMQIHKDQNNAALSVSKQTDYTNPRW